MTQSKPAKFNGTMVPHDTSTAELIEQLKSDPSECGPAYIALGCRPDQEAFHTLVSHTKDSDWHRRQLATAALRFHPMGKRALPALELLITDDVPQVVWTACSTMAELGVMSERLIYVLQGDDPKSRAAALKALVKLRQKQIFNYVLKVFERETFSEPREAAVAFLTEFADESNWRDLAAVWIKDVQPIVRMRACSLTAKFGTANDIDIVNDLLEDSNTDVRKAAYHALLKIGG